MEPIAISHPKANCSAPVISKKKLHLYQVTANDSGEGLPYAPVDWPNPGDKWRWQVGKRVEKGYFKDRYLYPPSHFPKGAGNKRRLASKVAVKQYVHSMFPGADVDALLNSFIWRIPSKEPSHDPGCKEGNAPYGSALSVKVGCKAGNKACCSLVEARNAHPKFMSCSICCSELGFCRYCCCILCCKTVDSEYGGYNYIRCEAMLDEDFICGHIAHVDCGLRAYLAGTVGGSIGLDAEYYCRRCDSRTDIVPHVAKLLETCKTIVFPDDIEQILAVGIRLLHNSKKANAQWLLHHIQLAMAKLKRGAKLEDVWSKANISSITPEGSYDNGISNSRSITEEAPLNAKPKPRGASNLAFDHQMESFKLKDEFDQVMCSLKQSQQHEYKVAEERLLAQKNIIQNSYEQLEKARSDLLRNASSENTEVLLKSILERVKQIEREVIRFNEMKEVANGFGRTSEQILKNNFSLEADKKAT